MWRTAADRGGRPRRSGPPGAPRRARRRATPSARPRTSGVSGSSRCSASTSAACPRAPRPPRGVRGGSRRGRDRPSATSESPITTPVASMKVTRPCGARPELVRQRVPARRDRRSGALRGVALDQRQAHEQIAADAIEEVRLDRRPQVQLARQQRQDDEPERDREQLAADAQLHGSSSSSPPPPPTPMRDRAPA